MTEQTAWLLAIVAVLAAALIGFFVGRQFSGAKKQLEALESENSRQKEEISGYKREVESHFDKTATLFASMAGSYKDLFEHLSSGYEKLSEGSARELFRDRIAALLLEGGKDGKGAKQLLEEGVKSPSPAFDREGFDKPAGSAASAASTASTASTAAAAAAAGGAVAAGAGEDEAPAGSAAAASGEGQPGEPGADDTARDESAGAEAPPVEGAKKEMRGEAGDTGEGQEGEPAAAAEAAGAASEGSPGADEGEEAARMARRGDDTR